MNRRFDETNKRIDEVRDEMKEVKHDLRLNSRKLEQVYEARERVKITFGWQWGMASMFIAIVAAGITKIFS